MSEEILKVLEKLKNKSNYQRDCNDGGYFIELFANEIYILCKFMEDLQQKVEQLENIRKEAIEYVLKKKLYRFKYDDEELFEITTDKKAKDDLLNILNKGSDKE